MSDSKKKVLCLLSEAPFVDSDPTSNPSVSWLQKYFSKYECIFLLRGIKKINCSDSIISLPASKNTLDLLSKLAKCHLFRKDFLKANQSVQEMKDQCSFIWLRAPGLAPILLSGCWKKKYASKMVIHLCANRLTASFLFQNFNLINIGRFLWGLLLRQIFRLAEWKGARFFHTGEHVKNNFKIKNSTYLIDFVPHMLNSVYQRQGFVFLGRTSKLNKNEELRRLANILPNKIDVYGPGSSQHNVDWVSYNGILSPSKVPVTISKYSALVCITEEYYEGFPRVIAEAISQNMWIIVNRDSTFYKDVREYPYLIVSNDIESSRQLDDFLHKQIIDNEKIFQKKILKRSLIDV